VVSPPIEVLAFPDQESMKPFLPLHDGKPSNIAGFFRRGDDANLIVLAVPGSDSAFSQLQVILHEYAHLLFRHNGRIWPMWLNEGMADIYSTFQAGGYRATIAQPIRPYLIQLSQRPWMPLKELFEVNHDSPQYNEGERQGTFYAESWLLTHFMVSGGRAEWRQRFPQFTKLLRDGQSPVQAFTNALQTPLAVIESELHRYFEAGRFTPIALSLSENVSSAKAVSTRALMPVEVYFRLGSELQKIDRMADAETYFTRAQKLAPNSSLPYEGLGLLAAERDQHDEALRQLNAALERGSGSFLVQYTVAKEIFRQTSIAPDRYTAVPTDKATEIRDHLTKANAAMPSFAPAHELLGFFEMVQGEDLAAAERHLQRAIQLEPDNASYLISLAQLQIRNNKTDVARITLRPLLMPQAEAKLRKVAQGILRDAQQK
jgi:tetratricopeptide (TPR) repeat protein